MLTKFNLMAAWRKAIFVVALGVFAFTASGEETRKKLSSPQPIYPELARRMGLSGMVKIELTIGADGEIKQAKVIGGHPIFADAALLALRNWKYERANSETKVEVEFKFHL
jgi:protein TonB